MARGGVKSGDVTVQNTEGVQNTPDTKEGMRYLKKHEKNEKGRRGQSCPGPYFENICYIKNHI